MPSYCLEIHLYWHRQMPFGRLPSFRRNTTFYGWSCYWAWLHVEWHGKPGIRD